MWHFDISIVFMDVSDEIQTVTGSVRSKCTWQQCLKKMPLAAVPEDTLQQEQRQPGSWAGEGAVTLDQEA